MSEQILQLTRRSADAEGLRDERRTNSIHGAVGTNHIACPFVTNWMIQLTSGVYWGGGIRVYTPYTNLWCFLTAYTYLICHNKTGYMGIYALTVNKRTCTAPCNTKLLNFFPCTLCSTCNAYSWKVLLLVYYFWEQ